MDIKILKQIKRYVSSRIKSTIKRGDNYGQETYLNITKEYFPELKDSWDEYADSIAEFILTEMDKELQKYKKQQIMAITAKAKVQQAFDHAGLEYKITLKDQMKIEVAIHTNVYQPLCKYSTIKCSYDKIEDALPIIVETMLAIQDMVKQTNVLQISNR